MFHTGAGAGAGYGALCWGLWIGLWRESRRGGEGREGGM
jgi:hypothetical protein